MKPNSLGVVFVAMARGQSKMLTDGEHRIMDVVWRLEVASVKDVVERLQQDVEIAYNTVQTMMGILVGKGYLDRRKDGRAFHYSAKVSRAAARTEALQHVVGKFFGGSRRTAVFNLLESEEIDEVELQELRKVLDSHSTSSRRGDT